MIVLNFTEYVNIDVLRTSLETHSADLVLGYVLHLLETFVKNFMQILKPFLMFSSICLPKYLYVFL